MKAMMGVLLLLTAFAVAVPQMSAQEKSKSEDAQVDARAAETTPLKISVTFVEFEGEKKVKSLPYTLVVVADGRPPKSILKMGSRVPVYAGKEGSVQYLDVGSNIDCQATRAKDNSFDLKLDLDRSWVEGDVPVPVDIGTSSHTSNGQFPEPIVRQFRSALNMSLRDGQTIESAFATDPLSGKVFKVEVSLKVVK